MKYLKDNMVLVNSKYNHFKQIGLLFILFIGCIQISIAQYDIPEKPSFVPPIIDSTNTLNNQEFRFLYDKLKHYNDSTSTEIMIVIIPTTKGENIGLLAPKWGHKWEIGQKKEDNGVFILLAKNDRKIWISPGYGLEDKLTAGITGDIIRNHIIPEFKRDNYFEGLNKGTNAIFNVLAGSYKNNNSSDNSDFPFVVFLILIAAFIILIIAISKHRRNNNGNGSGNSKRNDLLEAIILSNMGRGSYNKSSSSGGFGGFGRSSGGSFGGFGGGGGFSGGGAGGSW